MKKIIFAVILALSSLNIANAQWVVINDSTHNPVTAFADNGYYLFVAVTGDGLYKTSNFGANWSLSSNIISTLSLKGIAVKDSFVFLATDTGLYKSCNNGTNWILLNLGINCLYSTAITIKDNYLFTGTHFGVKRSSDEGINWELINNEIQWTYGEIRSIVYSNDAIYISIFNNNLKIYKSINYGNNWSLISQDIPLNNIPYSLFANENLVLCGTALGVYKSTNSGISWSLIPVINANIGLFGFTSMSSKNVFISAWNYGFYVSNDYSQTFTQRNEGLFSLCSTALYKFGNYLYLGTNWGTVIYRRPLNELVNIKQINSNIPESYKLYQNYPNPFNPTTKIKYDVTGSKVVKLIVYNILGKEITTLVNEKQSPGTYEVSFDASNLSTGIYFYSLEVDGKRIDTKKILLIK